MPRPVSVALLQMRAVADPRQNLARTLEWIDEAARRGARIVCTQELFRSPYFCQTEDHANFALAESIPGPTTDTLGAAARRLGIVIVASLFERRAAGLYHNTAVVIDGSDRQQGRLVGMYRKMHIPDDPLYYEKFYFTPGDLGFLAFDTAAARTGVLVCWDQWFPEAARLTALRGAEILFYPTAIGWHPSEKAEWGERQYQSWETIQRSHAVANGLFVAVTNRVGFEPASASANGASPTAGIEFWGGSFICDPSGEVLARGSRTDEAIVMATCDLEDVERARTHWPFLRDRRIDAYRGLTERLLDQTR